MAQMAKKCTLEMSFGLFVLEFDALLKSAYARKGYICET